MLLYSLEQLLGVLCTFFVSSVIGCDLLKFLASSSKFWCFALTVRWYGLFLEAVWFSLAWSLILEGQSVEHCLCFLDGYDT